MINESIYWGDWTNIKNTSNIDPSKPIKLLLALPKGEI
jgi:hypothetical protein